MCRKWRFRVNHILEAVERIQDYSRGMDSDSFSRDRRTVDAVVRNFAIMGEAARLVPPEVQEAHPDVPWRTLRGMRNILVHDYDNVSSEVLWDTIQADLPPLAAQLRALLNDQSLNE